MRSTTIYRYDLPADGFVPWDDASGQWICEHDVEPIDVTPIGDLLAAHADADVELRLVPSLWPIRDLAVRGPWDFSLVRMANAAARNCSGSSRSLVTTENA